MANSNEGTSEDVAIKIRNVNKTFRLKEAVVHTLDSLNISVHRGQFVSVIGPSGCGKSTLLRVVAGLYDADEGGTVHVLEQQQSSRTKSRNVGVVFQTHNMLPWSTVISNMRLAAEVRGIPEGTISKRMNELLSLLKLEDFANSYPHQLSGGMRQRAALGQTLAIRPQVLLLDEPFGALDALTRDKLNIELLKLWQEMHQTVLLITHSIAEAVFLSDRVLVMSDRPGKIVKDIKIDLPRPRDAITSKKSPLFGQYVTELEGLMGLDGGGSV